jgi:amidase
MLKAMTLGNDMDATAQAELVRKREVTPLELVDAAIARIGKTNPTLNAVVWERFEQARTEAQAPDLPVGAFTGVPFLTKDLGCTTAGEPDSEGSRFLKNAGYRAGVTAELARRIRAAGFINLGRTNSPEFGAVATTEPLAWGATKNPWDLTHTAGGSSGGSCAAVAAGMVPVAHGSDGGGSGRVPAAACGIVGIKPSRGRISLYPSNNWVTPLSVPSFETRTIRDLAACLDFAWGALPGETVSPPAPARPYVEELGADPGRLRIGLLPRLPLSVEGAINPACARGVSETGKLLQSLGHHVELSSPPVLDDPATPDIFLRIWPVRLLAALESFERKLGKKAGPDEIEPVTQFFLERGRKTSAGEYLAALDDMDAFTHTIAAWFQNVDLLITPVTGTVTPKLGALALTPANLPNVIRWTPFTAWFNVTGQPALSLPLAESDEGLPVGVQVVSAYGREDLLIRVASQLERARPWKQRRPSVNAFD